MTQIIILILVIIAGVVVLEILRGQRKEPTKYHYKHKDFFMSRAEHECYDALSVAVGKDYLIFAQVHLPTLLDNKVVGQNWRGAFRHINGKSVDFVLCDKAYISPKLAIELDDKTHERRDRKERDVEVERVLEEAGLPLLRLENHGDFNSKELSERINTLLK
jgi:very-short-patch-repair endonuclease